MSAVSSVWYSLVGAFIGALPSLLLSRRLLRLERLSMQDPLTGLRSGRMLDGDVDLLSRSGPVALLLVDLDDFRRFNELGYREGGDRALVSATQRMMASLRRRADRVYRLHTAGDEFAALMSIRDERQALITAQRLCVALRDNGTPASIGVACCDGSTDPRACELLADASANKEKAKKAGKNRVYPSPFDDGPPPPPIAVAAERAGCHQLPELTSEAA